jgi:copper chaperone CopZ
MLIRKLIIAFTIILLGTAYEESIGQYSSFPAGNPAELGKVHWLRNYDDAVALSRKEQKPILILFQEVPGCSNCTRYGNEVLSHPLIVEAIESFFIPLCIYNNKAGPDKKILQQFNEPSWNNPVLRIINQDGKDIIPRLADYRSKSKALESITQGIVLFRREIPGYLHLLAEEFQAEDNNRTDEIYLSMYCFWSGEKNIGTMDGVISTEAGYMHEKEVVKVRFDKSKTSTDKIVTAAEKSGNADAVFGAVHHETRVLLKPAGPYRKDKEDKYYLRSSPYAVIPMTAMQKTKVNAAIAKSDNPEIFLSPAQLKILKNKNTRINTTDMEITDIWYHKTSTK